MSSRIHLNDLQVASPCPMSWDLMRGNEKARFCDRCQKHVYNFAALTTDEGLALMESTEGELCGRLTRRSDGMLMTADCPVGLAAKIQRFQRRLIYSMVAACLMILGFVSLRQQRGDQQENANRDEVTAMLEDWIDQLREWAGWTSKRSVTVMGGCPGPPPRPNGK